LNTARKGHFDGDSEGNLGKEEKTNFGVEMKETVMINMKFKGVTTEEITVKMKVLKGILIHGMTENAGRSGSIES
jgi:hypothetical protein